MHNALQKITASKRAQKKKEWQFKTLSVLSARALEVKKVKVLILPHWERQQAFSFCLTRDGRKMAG